MRKVTPPGTRFGQWTVMASTREDGRTKFLAACQCGQVKIVDKYSVTSAKSVSCCGNSRRTHGMSRTPIYKIWESMKARCGTPGTSYEQTRLDPLWQTFEGFIDNPPEGLPYAQGLQLSRFGDKGDYGPSNTRWRTQTENLREMLERTTMHRLADGRFGVDVARSNGISPKLFADRVGRGWTPERAATQQVRTN